MSETLTVMLPISDALADVAGAPRDTIERIIRTIGSPNCLPFIPFNAAVEAEAGISEAVRIMDLMGRGQDARNLAVVGNNLRAAIRRAGEE